MILADSGFWFALHHRDDEAHAAAVRAAQDYAGEIFVSTWPVLAEACHLLNSYGGPSTVIKFIKSVREGVCEIFDIPVASLSRVEALMRKFRDLPMDLADASLVVLAEELGEGRILTTDQRDFKTYRWKNTRPFKNLLFEA